MPKVTIYTTPTCMYCKATKAFFAEHNVAYEEKDVSADAKARDEMIAKSHQMGVPVIEVDGKLITGFDKPALAAALGIK